TVLPRMIPIDSNTTPTLTTATTATPTPGSTSAQLGGSHSMDANGSMATSASSSAMGNGLITNGSSVSGAGYPGSQKHSAGRILPSLAVAQGSSNATPHMGAINSEFARTSIADTMQQQQQQKQHQYQYQYQQHRYPPVSSGAAAPQQAVYQQLSSASPMLLQPAQVSSARSSFYPQLPSA
ncbi:hypothetical protein EV177_010508, partial [Coemansia sp. RSA 1804]